MMHFRTGWRSGDAGRMRAGGRGRGTEEECIADASAGCAEEDLGELALAATHALEEAPEDEEEGEDHKAHEEERLRVHRLVPLTRQPVRWVCEKRGTRPSCGTCSCAQMRVRKVVKRKEVSAGWISGPTKIIYVKPLRNQKLKGVTGRILITMPKAGHSSHNVSSR